MKKSRLSIGSQTVLRESDIQTEPCNADDPVGINGISFRDVFRFQDGRVTIDDVISAMYLERDHVIVDKDELLFPINTDVLPYPSKIMDHLARVSQEEANAESKRKLDHSQMVSMHRMDEKLHLLRKRMDDQQTLASKSAHKSHQRSLQSSAREYDLFCNLVNHLGKPLSLSFRGSGCSDMWQKVSKNSAPLGELEIKDLRKKLAVLQRANPYIL